MDWFDRIPKVELHVHLEGAIPHATLWELIQRYGGDPAAPDLEALGRRFAYRDFAHFIEMWSWKNQFLREYEDFTHIAHGVAQDLARQNVRYVEMFFSPSLFLRHGLEVQRLTEAVRTGLNRVPEIEVALIGDLVRDYGPQSEGRTLEKLGEVKDRGVIGIGIGGSEHEFPPEPFAALYDEARRLGFRTNAHAGEAAGAASIWAAVRRLGVDRIGHGTRAYEDEALVDYIAESRVPLEMCPVSNVRTGIVPALADHPIREYFERGIVVSVNTDDPAMFGTSLADEYRQLEQELGFLREEICTLILLAVESSWLPEERKRELAREFQEEESWRGESREDIQAIM